MRIIFCNLIFVAISFLYANELQQKIQTFIPKNTYQTNEKFINRIFSNEKSFYVNDKLNIQKVIATLKSNGLLVLKLAKPSNVSITFRINSTYITDKNPSFTFLAYSTSNILSGMGYSYFYITEAKKQQEKIFLTYTLNTESNVDPLVMTNNLIRRGYDIIDVHKNSPTHWTYDIGLRDSKITNTNILKKGENILTQINGKYWLTFDRLGELNIAPNDNTSAWYPKILIFDNDMKLIDSIILIESKKSYKIAITSQIKHILVTDNYNASILRNGVTFDFKY